MLKLSKIVFVVALFFCLIGCQAGKETTLTRLVSKVMGPSQAEKNRQIMTMLRSPSAHHRQQAVLQLTEGQALNWESTGELVALMATDDESSFVRAAAVSALVKIDSEEQYLPQVLEKTAVDPAPDVRLETINVFKERNNEQSQNLLIEILRDDEDVRVRGRAAETLGFFPDDKVVDALIETLDEQDFSVLFRCRESLNTLTGQDLEYDRQAWRKWRQGTDQVIAPRENTDKPWYKIW